MCFQYLRRASGGAAGYPWASGRGPWDGTEVHMSKQDQKQEVVTQIKLEGA